MESLNPVFGGGTNPVRKDQAVNGAKAQVSQKEDRKKAPEEGASSESLSQDKVSSGSENYSLTYAVDRETKEVITKIVDAKSGKVLREVPAKDLREAQQALAEYQKLLFDKGA